MLEIPINLYYGLMIEMTDEQQSNALDDHITLDMSNN